MNILVTGAKGFVGKNLVANLRNIAEGKNRTRPSLHIEQKLLERAARKGRDVPWIV